MLSPDILYFLDQMLFWSFEHSQIVMHLKTAQFFTIRSEIAEEVSAGNICTKFIRRMQGNYNLDGITVISPSLLLFWDRCSGSEVVFFLLEITNMPRLPSLLLFFLLVCVTNSAEVG